jgi:AcrR family transcriptional regulator
LRTPPEEIRLAIRRVALATFSDRGFRASTLEEVGAKVGITRGTVLYHFNSKAELLAAAVDPYLRALDQLLDSTHVDDPPTAGQRRRLLTELATVFLDHRGALHLLATDVTARAALGLSGHPVDRAERIISLLVGSQEPGAARVRAACALGALSQPIAHAWLDLDDAEVRSELIDAVALIIDRPAPTL